MPISDALNLTSILNKKNRDQDKTENIYNVHIQQIENYYKL
jgi:hypothetical protein